jgi:hypothetical protein
MAEQKRVTRTAATGTRKKELGQEGATLPGGEEQVAQVNEQLAVTDAALDRALGIGTTPAEATEAIGAARERPALRLDAEAEVKRFSGSQTTGQ